MNNPIQSAIPLPPKNNALTEHAPAAATPSNSDAAHTARIKAFGKSYLDEKTSSSTAPILSHKEKIFSAADAIAEESAKTGHAGGDLLRTSQV